MKRSKKRWIGGNFFFVSLERKLTHNFRDWLEWYEWYEVKYAVIAFYWCDFDLLDPLRKFACSLVLLFFYYFSIRDTEESEVGIVQKMTESNIGKCLTFEVLLWIHKLHDLTVKPCFFKSLVYSSYCVGYSLLICYSRYDCLELLMQQDPEAAQCQ